MSLQIDEATLKSVVEDVLKKLSQNGTSAPAAASADCGCKKNSKGRDGVFQDAGEAAEAAAYAQKELRKQGIAGRAKVIDIVKHTCAEKAEEWGNLEFNETKIGRLEHKIGKLQGIPGVPGVEC